MSDFYESEEDEDGKLLVANVILNRVNSEVFPDTVSEVVLQKSKGVTQFSPVSSGKRVAEALCRLGVTGKCFYALKRKIVRREECHQLFYRLGIRALLKKLVLYAVRTDLIELIDRNTGAVEFRFSKAAGNEQTPQNATVVDLNGKAADADRKQSLRRGRDQLDLTVGRFAAENVDIALLELAESSLLGALRTPYTVDLDTLHREHQLTLVIGVIAAKRKGQVIAQTEIGDVLNVALFHCLDELFAALHDLKDQIQILAALGLIEVFRILDRGGGDTVEACRAVDRENGILKVIAETHLLGKVIVRAFYGCGFHGVLCPSVGSEFMNCRIAHREAKSPASAQMLSNIL